VKRRPYQSEAIRAMKLRRVFAMLFERQAGKSTTLADIALLKMMKIPNYTVIYASASLLLGTEIVLKATEASSNAARDLIEKEAGVLQGAAERFQSDAREAGMQFATADAGKDKLVQSLSADDFADLFEKQRLEFRVYHDRTRYSRTKVIAPNVATARGWSGTVLLDEIAFIRGFMDLWIAIEPIIDTQQEFKVVLSTTPPQDDTHASFELLAAPAGMQFTPNPRGNWYESESGIPVLRADAFDTHLAGKKIFDVRTGEEITPTQSFQRAISKEGWRINHGLQWIVGGTAACNLLLLKTAQERGVNKCSLFLIDEDGDFDSAIAWLALNLDPDATTAIGFDVATTTEDTSNPSVCAIVQGSAIDVVIKAFVVWKTRDPEVARERLSQIVTVINRRPGGRVKSMCIDATNEKYFAEDLRRLLRAEVAVRLIVASEGITPEQRPSLEKPTNWKEFLGDQYVGVLEDNCLTLPPQVYVRTDHRLVKKDRGKFVCKPSPDGMHGDTFDAGKLAVEALIGKTDAIESLDPATYRLGVQTQRFSMFVPHRLV
jgi:hypothetical protein